VTPAKDADDTRDEGRGGPAGEHGPADGSAPAGEAVAPDEVLQGPLRAGRARRGGPAELTQVTPGSFAGPDGEGAPAEGGGEVGPSEEEDRSESIERPGKVMRVGSMVKQLLDEVRQAPLDEAGRIRLREIYELSVKELATGLSPDLVAELDRMAMPFDNEIPTEAELRIAQAQLVGWLEGLFHGIQAALVAQQMAARAQLEEMRQRGLPRGAVEEGPPARPGTYL
jgi:hypothetical protein